MKYPALTSLLCAGAMALTLQVSTSGQPGKIDKEGLPEVNVVLRISRKLINELTTKKFQRTDPVCLCVEDTSVAGKAWTDATFTVQFDPNDKESAFVLQLRGTT